MLADILLTEAAVIPGYTEVRVARKFTGNAEAAQQEIMVMAFEIRKGKTVVRVSSNLILFCKLRPMYCGYSSHVRRESQPYMDVQAKGYLFLRSHNVSAVIVPGRHVSSTLFCWASLRKHPPQRGAAESLIVCTGVDRHWRSVGLPGYLRG